MPRRRVRRATAAALLALGILAGTGCAGLGPPLPEAVAVRTWRAPAAPLRAGAAAVDVTPEGRVFLAGYSVARRSEGVHDPLFARALVLESGDLRLGLVAVDVVGIQRQDRLALDARLAAEGFDPRLVWLHATHSHAGPDTLGFWGVPPFVSGRDPAYLERLADGVIEALARARDALRPAELAAGSVALPTRGILRNLRRPGLVDAELGVVHVREAGGGASVASLVVLGCHPEVLPRTSRVVSADFPAATVARLEGALGGVGIYASGALGGLVTPDVREGAEPHAEAARIGGAVGDAALDAIAELGAYESSPRLAAAHTPLHLPLHNWRYGLATRIGLLDRTVHRGGWLETEVNLWALGALRLLSVPGEITPDLGLRARAAAGGRPALLLGLVNDELGYLLPAADFDQRLYAYERGFSPGRESGQRVLERLRDLTLLLRQTLGSGR